MKARGDNVGLMLAEDWAPLVAVIAAYLAAGAWAIWAAVGVVRGC